MRRITIIIIILVHAFVLAKAQTIVVLGKVTDKTGEPLEMVHIRTDKGDIGTISNFKGEYELRVSGSDTIRLLFTRLGFNRYTKVINVNANEGKPINLNVQMSQNTSVINDIEVTAQRRNNDNMERFDFQSIKNAPTASGNSIEDMLGTMAGVTINNEMSSQYSVRGGSFDENMIYVNGIEIYRPQLISSGQQEGLSFINPSMIKSIGFSTGGFASEYGDKMSSVLDITYKTPEQFEADANISLLGVGISLGSRTKKFSQLHGIRYKQNNSLLSSLDTKGEYDPRFFDYQTFLNYDLNKNLHINFLGNLATNHYNFTPQSRETSFGTFGDIRRFKVYFDGHEKDQFDTYFGALTLDYIGFKNTVLQLQTSSFITDERVTYDISGEYWLDMATDGGQGSLGIGAYHEHARNYLKASVMTLSFKGTTQVGHNKIKYGISLQRENVNDRISEWERRDSSGYTLPHLEDQVQMIYNLHSAYKNHSSRISAFLQNNYGWNAMSGRFFLLAGLRVSHWTFNNETLMSPRASLSYTPDDHPGLIYRFAAGIYSQSPFYKEYRSKYIDQNGNTMINMNTNIKAQRSYQIILGSDYTFIAYNRPFKFTAEAYYKNITNYIPYTVDNVQIRYLGRNSGKAFASGIDLKLFGEFVDGTDSWLSLSLMQSKEDYGGLKTPRPTEQRYSIGVFFSDFWPGNDSYKVVMKGIMNDGLPFYSPIGGRESGTFRTAAYKRIDLGAYRVWNGENSRFMKHGKWSNIKEINLGFDVFNLMDFDNINSYYWVTAVDNMQYAVPNYLTRRMFSISFGVHL